MTDYGAHTRRLLRRQIERARELEDRAEWQVETMRRAVVALRRADPHEARRILEYAIASAERRGGGR